MYFNILDGQNKGYLDKETVDVFTKEIAEKCSTKERKFDYANITQLVFDSIQPRESKKYKHEENDNIESLWKTSFEWVEEDWY